MWHGCCKYLPTIFYRKKQPSDLGRSRDISQDRVHANHRRQDAQRFEDAVICNAEYPPDLCPSVQHLICHCLSITTSIAALALRHNVLHRSSKEPARSGCHQMTLLDSSGAAPTSTPPPEVLPVQLPVQPCVQATEQTHPVIRVELRKGVCPLGSPGRRRRRRQPTARPGCASCRNDLNQFAMAAA